MYMYIEPLRIMSILWVFTKNNWFIIQNGALIFCICMIIYAHERLDFVHKWVSVHMCTLVKDDYQMFL